MIRRRFAALLGAGLFTLTSCAHTEPGHASPAPTASPQSAVSKMTEVIVMCQVIVDISPASAMSFIASMQSSGEGKYEPCDVASKLANVVIPKITG